jgi:hypothetical protein
MPKHGLLDRLVALLQQRHGGEEAYAKRVKELGTKHGRPNLAADDTHFSSMDMVSMELIIEALEQEHIDMGIVRKMTPANTGEMKLEVRQQ